MREKALETTATEEQKWPSVTIYILNWNGRSLLESCLPPLTNLNYPTYNITLIDNNSDDDSVAYTKHTFPQIIILQNEANIGFSKGMNVGLRQHKTEIAVLLNNDVEVRPDWLTELVRPMLDDPTVGITGSKLYYGDGRTLQHAGVMIEYPLAFGRHRFYQQEDGGQADTLCEVDYVTGASMAISNTVLHKIGIFDEDFSPFYYEESDFCLRAHAAGFKIIYAPQSVALHHESMTFKQYSRPLFHNMNRNRLLFLLKHLPADDFLEEFPVAETTFLKSSALPEQVQTMHHIYLEMLLKLEEHLTKRDLQEHIPAYQTILIQLAQTAVSHTIQHTPTPTPSTLQQEATLRPYQFHSTIPIFGGLIANLRRLWGTMAAQWMTRDLIRQQNIFNQQVATHLHQLDERVVAQDHDLVPLSQQMAQLNLTLHQLQKQMQQMEVRLSQLEERQ